MNIQAAYKWIETETYNQWRLEDSKGEKVSSYIDKEESRENGLARLNEILPILAPGNYTLKGFSGYSRSASASSFQFAVQANTTQNIGRKMDSAEMEKIFLSAKNMAREEMEAEQFRKDVDKRLSALELELKKLAEIVQDLTDDDDENDDDALSRLSTIGEKLPELANGFSNMKSLFESK